MITGIIVALPEELSTLTQKKLAPGSCAFISENVLVAVSGMGPKNSASATKQLIAKGAARIISWGCAGALDETLKPGDLTIVDTIIAEDTQQLVLDSAWHQQAITELSHFFTIHSGTLAESSKILVSCQDKINLQNTTHAQVLDMESFASANVAIDSQLPFIAIRVIADPVNVDLPAAVDYAMNEHGLLVFRKLVLFLFSHPGQIPSLIRLGLHFRAASNKLKLVAKHLDIITGFDQADSCRQ